MKFFTLILALSVAVSAQDYNQTPPVANPPSYNNLPVDNPPSYGISGKIHKKYGDKSKKPKKPHTSHGKPSNTPPIATPPSYGNLPVIAPPAVTSPSYSIPVISSPSYKGNPINILPIPQTYQAISNPTTY
ncbi:hypothetical protein K502DRAFT_341698 [Neoconidiobolus thromboides FSU 785]|nr:hypothetical protein K502DRAFT_341698 [Neoconidiobolus thromboides FSU 785]